MLPREALGCLGRKGDRLGLAVPVLDDEQVAAQAFLGIAGHGPERAIRSLRVAQQPVGLRGFRSRPSANLLPEPLGVGGRHGQRRKPWQRRRDKLRRSGADRLAGGGLLAPLTQRADGSGARLLPVEGRQA